MKINITRIKFSLFWAFIMIIILWLVRIYQTTFDIELFKFGILPRTAKGVRGIFLAPFIHGSWQHLYSNSLPLFLLTFGLFYFYPQKSWKILLYGWLITDFIVWLIGRYSYHIGASGIVYMLTSFHFFAGIFSGKRSMLGISLLIIFLYGSSIWGMFPTFSFDKSWESHAAGYFTGFILALGQIKSSDQNNDNDKRLLFRSEPDLKINFEYDYKENLLD